MWKIDNDISPPEFKKGRKAKYPFPSMEVGQSVFIAGADHNSNSAAAAKVHAARTGKKFSMQKSYDGLRIWRTA